MKFGVYLGIFLFSSLAFATEPTLKDPASLENVPGANPYEKLKNAFSYGSVIDLYKLPTSSESTKWSCSYSDYDFPEHIRDASLPVQVHSKIVVFPATPSKGPLFPEIPAKVKIEDWVSFVSTYYSEKDIEQTLTDEFIHCKTHVISRTPDYVAVLNSRCPVSGENIQVRREIREYSFRVWNDMIFIKEMVSGHKVDRKTLFSYCWKKAN